MHLKALMLDDGLDEAEQNMDKKIRRLSHNQVKALEKTFEVDNKLINPRRKVALAHELGLQPRQVAIWFQNRRARWKIKQLEMDYNNLKANYESLKLNYDQLEQNKLILTTELVVWGIEGAGVTLNHSNNVTKAVETKVLSGGSDSSGMNQDTTTTIRNFQLLTAPQDLSNPELDFCSPSQPQYAYEDDLMHSKSVLGNAHQQQWTKMEEGCPFGSVGKSFNIYSVDQVLTFGW